MPSLPPTTSVCRRYAYVRADVYALDDIRFTSIIVTISETQAIQGRALGIVSDTMWELAAFDAGHELLAPPDDDVAWNDTIVRI